ncbi:hypothetical protein [Parafilimonas sp.]|uniref:hypothetical protein n=1 Tax=Parafilimonas sp. TaxID=1969739 RepID=UPI0039E5E58B
MKHNCTRLLLAALAGLIFQTLSVDAKAQKCNCTNSCDGIKPLPAMWVSDSSADKRKKQLFKKELFAKSKYQLLKETGRLYHNNPYFFISKSNLNEIIKADTGTQKAQGLRVIFACFVKKGSDTSIQLNDGQIVLLFTAADKNTDYGKCYVVDNDTVLHKVPDSNKINWTTEYNNHILPALRKTIDSNSDNDNGSKNYTDTKSIYYENKRIIEAFEEIKTNTMLKDFIGFRITISAYDKKGKDSTCYDGHRYKKRMILQFDYVKTGNKLFKFEDSPDFCCRKCNMNHHESFLKSKDNTIMALDNGHLCPANCPVTQ